MPDRYLQSLAAEYARQGKALKDYTFVFPNRRAGLFFRKYLGQALSEPVWSPEVLTIDDLFHQLSDLKPADTLSLLVRLYEVYRQDNPHAEPFGQFLRWGQMMLSDFSEIDNHLVPNVEALFTTIRDLKELDYKFDYLSERQREAIRRFWGDVYFSGRTGTDTSVRDRFLHTWDRLLPCYNGLRQSLLRDGLAYEGMLHCEVIGHLNDTGIGIGTRQYVFIGFNALTKSEEALMLRFKKEGHAGFRFDYNHPFLRDPENRASLFYQHNRELFGLPETNRREKVSPEDISQRLSVTRCLTSSDVEEAGQVYRLLDELSATETGNDWTRTAVVLPDEQMLLPLLTNIPPSVPTVNITMGYPVRATRAFIPVMQDPAEGETPLAALQRLRRLWEEDGSEAARCLLQVLNRVEDVLIAPAPFPIAVNDFFYILRMLTTELSVPYVGEPLSGLQIMGVLETRALDFDNLIIMGFNDELYPGKSKGSSYIPYTLRRGFGMPTPERQDAIFAYNFYRMLSHARRVWFLTNAQADDRHTGEVSRYYQQLVYQYHLPVATVTLPSAPVTTKTAPPAGLMTPTATDESNLSFSPSALNAFLRCEQKYYYRYVLGLREEEPATEDEVDDRTLGTAFHAIVQRLYQEEQEEVTAGVIQRIRAKLQQQWDTMTELDPVRKDPIATEVVRCYVERLLLLDEQQGGFTRIGLEKTYRYSLPVEGATVTLNGTIDRIDRKDGIIRLIDYKTGHADLTYKDLAQAFTTDAFPYVLQTMTYCLLYAKNTGTESPLAPYIFPLRAISDPARFSGKVHPTGDKEGRFIYDAETERLTESLLAALISRILTTRQQASFAKTDDTRKCESCAFAALCGR